MSKPRLLDLFCGAGGAAMGYSRAGFEVVGVDIKPQPHYPFEFHQADAMTYPLDGFDVIHASPPCQAFTQMSARYRDKGGKADLHENLLTPMRERLLPETRPWVIENVVGAKRFMRTDLKLHGGLFGLGVHRPRLFESNVFMLWPSALRTVEPVGVYGSYRDGRRVPSLRNSMKPDGTYGKKSIIRIARSLEEAQRAMGIDWMTWDELKEAIPPAYTEWLGQQLMAVVEERAA